MADQFETADAKQAAQLALFKKIESLADATTRYDQLEKLALAYRYVSGGAQPGSVTVDK